ncbi:fibronectin type III domain-containing protein, partial [Lysinibacillus irui]|uniref:hypothetical protein n=1 Tax=Lysinibacillus irui TaxID=2998077 RepID=UPI002AD4D6FB
MRFLFNYKIVFLSALLLSFFYVSVSPAYAVDACDYRNGVLDNVSADTTSSNGAANFRKIFDNDENSYAAIGNQENHNIIILDDVVNIESFCIKAPYNSNDAIIVRFYNAENKMLGQMPLRLTGNFVKYDLSAVGVKKINFKHDNYSVQIAEFEMFQGKPLKDVTDVKISSSFNQLKVSWQNEKDVESVNVYLDDVLYQNVKGANTVDITKLKSETNYKISLFAVYKNGSSGGLHFNAKTLGVPALSDDFVSVSNVKQNSARLDFDLTKVAGKEDVKEIQIYDAQKNKVQTVVVNGEMITASHVLQNLDYNKDYKYSVVVVYSNGDVTPHKDVGFKTSDAVKEVSNLTATATAQDVSLTWKMPIYKELEKARIYRQKTDAGLFARMFRSASTYEPLFETNGTTFKDLTVKADTEYTYKVTTVDTDDNETEGKTIKIRTKKMSVSGGGVEKDENGDFVITWTSPTTGKIKVLVGGKEYAIVSASDKKIVIPKDKMVFDILGNP